MKAQTTLKYAAYMLHLIHIYRLFVLFLYSTVDICHIYMLLSCSHIHMFSKQSNQYSIVQLSNIFNIKNTAPQKYEQVKSYFSHISFSSQAGSLVVPKV